MCLEAEVLVQELAMQASPRDPLCELPQGWDDGAFVSGFSGTTSRLLRATLPSLVHSNFER